METLSRNLRRRAKELGLSDAEVARRAGLSERRYGHYVAGTREPDFATFLRICEVLAVTPNDLLLSDHALTKGNNKIISLDKIKSHLSAFDDREIQLAVALIEAMYKTAENNRDK